MQHHAKGGGGSSNTTHKEEENTAPFERTCERAAPVEDGKQNHTKERGEATPTPHMKARVTTSLKILYFMFFPFGHVCDFSMF